MRKWMILTALLAGLSLQAQPPLQQKVEKILSEEPLRSAVVGLVARDASGKVLVSVNPDRMMVPASNMKIITTGAALHAFGPERRFDTRLGYTGQIVDGTLEGDVYIIGGGDPTLGTRDSIAVKTDALFWRWKTMLRDAGIERIHGRIIGDGRAFEGHLENSSWTYDDTGTSYGTGCSALSFYANAQDYAVSAGAKPGDPVRVRITYPDTPWMHFTNYGVTGPKGSGNSLYLFTTDLAPYAELRGSFAIGRSPKTESFANKWGALTCAYYFWQNLRSTGWDVTGGYADIDRSGYVRGADFVPLDKAGDPVVVGASPSPALWEIARETNYRSDNFYAESLLRLMGEAATSIAVYDSCYVAEAEVLRSLGMPEAGLRVEDGSGLSRRNYVSPSWMVSFLRAMQGSRSFEAFLTSLPQAGKGTLASLIPQAPSQVKSRFRLKSGSMDGVLCYSGYYLDPSGKPAVTFSLMVNNSTATTARLRDTLGRILLLLVY